MNVNGKSVFSGMGGGLGRERPVLGYGFTIGKHTGHPSSVHARR